MFGSYFLLHKKGCHHDSPPHSLLSLSPLPFPSPPLSLLCPAQWIRMDDDEAGEDLALDDRSHFNNDGMVNTYTINIAYNVHMG